MFTYKTNVRINVSELNNQCELLKKAYDAIGTRETHEGRSAFSQWNNLEKFKERVSAAVFDTDLPIIPVTGSSSGDTARIYFKPSVTSLAKPLRKCIVPVDSNRQFLFTDLKAAEFALACVFAQETEALEAYQRGEDIYMYYKDLFPDGTPRKTIKTILIANLYNKTAYSTALDLGISEVQAQRLLDTIAERMPRITMLKQKIYSYDRIHNGYFCPNGFDQRDLKKIANIDPDKGFNPNFAASCYMQSALGFIMQQFTTKILPRVSGTFLSVFDSVLIEHSPNRAEALENFITKAFYPLLPDKFGYGKTFWQAAYGD